MGVVVAITRVGWRVIEIHHQANLLTQEIVVASFSSFENTLNRPAEVIRHIEKWLCVMVLKVKDYLANDAACIVFLRTQKVCPLKYTSAPPARLNSS